jgi:lipopolysaccharide exporter
MSTPIQESSEQCGISRQKTRRFAGDVLTLTSATVISQVFGTLAAPLLARLFSPHAFGLAALFLSTVGMLGTVVCLRYEVCIPLPEAEEQAANSLALSLLCALLVSLLALPFIVLGGQVFHWLHAAELAEYRWLLPVVLFLTGVNQAFAVWCTRIGNFRLLSLSQLLTSICTMGLQICLGLMGYVSGGVLILSNVVGITASTLILLFGIEFSKLFKALSWSRIFAVAKRYSRFPKYGILTGFLNSTSWQLPALFLARFFSASVVGQYSLGNRLIRIPMNLIGINIAKVLFQRAAVERNEGVLSELVERTFHYLLSLSMFPCLLLTFIGKDLFVLAFGGAWAEAGIYTQILSVWVCFWFVSSPLSVVLDVLEEQALEFRINILIFVSRFVALLAGGLARNPRMALALFSASGVLVYGYYSFIILRVSGASVSRMSKELLLNLAIFAPAGLVLALLKQLEAPSLVIVAMAFLLLCLYLANLIRIDPFVRELITRSWGERLSSEA